MIKHILILSLVFIGSMPESSCLTLEIQDENVYYQDHAGEFTIYPNETAEERY